MPRILSTTVMTGEWYMGCIYSIPDGPHWRATEIQVVADDRKTCKRPSSSQMMRAWNMPLLMTTLLRINEWVYDA